MKSHSQSLKAGLINVHMLICILKQKTLPGLSLALSLNPIKYMSEVDSTLPGGVKRIETQASCHICNCAYYISHDDLFH